MSSAYRGWLTCDEILQSLAIYDNALVPVPPVAQQRLDSKLFGLRGQFIAYASQEMFTVNSTNQRDNMASRLQKGFCAGLQQLVVRGNVELTRGNIKKMSERMAGEYICRF